MSSDELFSPEGGIWLQSQYVSRERSTYDIARELGISAARVRKALIKHGIRLRTRGEAQAAALAAGRHKHPTRGVTRDPETRARISAGLAQSWRELDEEERERRVGLGRDQWEKMHERERTRVRALAAEAVKQAAAGGSKLERFLAEELLSRGYEVELRASVLHQPIDLYLPGLHVVIDVRGPGHYLPVWGVERLKKTLEKDDMKSSLLTSHGLNLVIIKNLTRTLSAYQMRNTLVRLLLILAGPTHMGPAELEVKT